MDGTRRWGIKGGTLLAIGLLDSYPIDFERQRWRGAELGRIDCSSVVRPPAGMVPRGEVGPEPQCQESRRPQEVRQRATESLHLGERGLSGMEWPRGTKRAEGGRRRLD